MTALAILDDLIRLRSVNPAYDGGAGEREVADYVENVCRSAGLDVFRQEVFPGRENVVAVLRVGRPGSALLFEAHTDTVSLGNMQDPLVPTYRDGRVYGRGACDAKASLAAMLHCITECARNPARVPGDLVLCAAVDEEHAYRGVLSFLDSGLPVAGAVVGEPTELGIVVAHKGCARFSIGVHGKAAHSSVPHEGENAIYRMAQVLRVIGDDIEPSLASRRHPLCGPATISVGTIRGGSQINIVPDACEIHVDRRIIPGEEPRQVFDDIVHTLRTRLDGSVDMDATVLLLDHALDTGTGAAVVRCARDAATSLAVDPSPRGATYGSDASKLQSLGGIPSIVLGPGSIKQAHSAHEWVALDEVETAAALYLEMAQTFARQVD